MKALIVSSIVAGAWIVGCGAAPSDKADETSSTDDALMLADFEPGENVHMMPVRNTSEDVKVNASPNVTPPSGAHLTYYGGPVLSAVKVYSVYWGSGVNYTSHLNSFYKDITNSTYFDWLSEYDTPTQNIGRGSFGGAFTITPSTKSKNLSDATIQKEISKQITAGHLPKNNANTLYMVHFPPGISITMQGSQSCVQFCAYHGTFKKSSAMVFYGVIPDQGGGCAGGCGPSPIQEGTTDVASHELIEAVTDPGVGLATTNGPPLAWYDQANGEIGDICAGQNDSAQVDGYTVQVEWSNKRNACVSH